MKRMIPLDTKSTQFLTRFIVESDAIESIQADAKLVNAQLKRGMQNGHVGALLLLEQRSQEKEETITKDLICQVQGLITAEQHTKLGGHRLKRGWIGNYRVIDVGIGGRMAPDPGLVPSLMLTWVGRVTAWQRECHSHVQNENLREIARCHFEYERIHPFVDGNGRSGRALAYYLMRYRGIKPFIFTNADKYETYYRCFEDPEAMCEYFEIKTSGEESSLSARSTS